MISRFWRMATCRRLVNGVSIFREDRRHEVCAACSYMRCHITDGYVSVSLARAVYSRASVLFLDDVLSAGTHRTAVAIAVIVSDIISVDSGCSYGSPFVLRVPKGRSHAWTNDHPRISPRPAVCSRRQLHRGARQWQAAVRR